MSILIIFYVLYIGEFFDHQNNRAYMILRKIGCKIIKIKCVTRFFQGKKVLSERVFSAERVVGYHMVPTQAHPAVYFDFGLSK